MGEIRSHKSKYNTLISNSIFFLLCSLSSKVIGYILLPIYTSSMSTEEYGVADILLSTNNLLYPIFALGMAGAVMRFCINEDEDRVKVFTGAIIIFILSSIVAFIIIPLVLRIFPQYEEYAIYVPIWLVLINAVNLVGALCKAFDKTHLIVYQNFIYALSMCICAIILVKKLDLGVYGYIYSYCIAYIISLIFLLVSINIKKYIKFKYKFTELWDQIKELLKYGVPLVPNSLAWWILQLSDRYMVAYWHGSGVNGLYSVAYKIPSILNVIINAFNHAWQLSAIKEFGKKNSIDFYNSVYRKYCALSYLVGAGLIVATRMISKILFSNDFFVAWKYVPFLIIATIINCQETYFSTFYLANKKTVRYFISSVMGAIINIFLNLLLIPKFSVEGATIATIISYFIVYILRSVDAKKTINMNILLKKNCICIVLLFIESYIYIDSTFPLPQRYVVCSGIVLVVGIIFIKEINEICLIVKKTLSKLLYK